MIYGRSTVTSLPWDSIYHPAPGIIQLNDIILPKNFMIYFMRE